ncbi:DUF6231 family protein [Thiobacillus sp.]|uniref:DUF6231 family protein n=1 Tax=Thiobacillus sp. TaxID=924 RepID=UPI0025F60A21|nr:DUF6231 family protein [Thiobacillus sp.]
MNWRDHLQARLLEMRPASVYALDEAARQMTSRVLPDTPVRAPGNPPDSLYALALGIDALNGLNVQQAQHLINQIRLYIAPRILLAVPSDCVLDEAMFRALGFTLSATDPTQNRHIHYYDLDTYKTVPDWLNSRYWAHPERWQP